MVADRVGEAEEKTSDKITREEVENIVATVWKEMFGLSDEHGRQRKDAFATIAARLVP